MKKQVQLIITIIVLLASLTGYGQNVGHSFTVDNITYEITSLPSNPSLPHIFTGQRVKVVDYGGNATEVTIPPKVNDQGIDYRVTEIGNEAFSGHGKADEDKLISVDMPHTVRSIGESAFRDNKLTEVVIPLRVNSIGASAFQDNPNLETVIVRSNNPTSLHENAFSNPSQINLLVPKDSEDAYKNDSRWNKFSSINAGTFIINGITYAITSVVQGEGQVKITDYDNDNGTETVVDIPLEVKYDGTDYEVTTIGYKAFNNKQLTQVTFSNTPTPSNVTSIGEDAFWQNALTSVVIPESVTRLGQRAFGTNQLSEVTIPNSITTISQWAFASNQFTELTIPANVASIGYQAFFGSLNLSLVTVERNDPPVLHATAFRAPHWDLRGQINLIVPIGTRDDYLANDVWKEFKSITYGLFTDNGTRYRISSVDDVEIIEYVGNAKEVTILPTVSYQGTDYNVTAIGADAFSYRQLTQLTLPNSITRIGYQAFRDNLLTEVTLPNSVTSIGERAFMYNQLPQLTIPSSVTSIEKDAFQANELTKVTFSTSSQLTRINEGVFKSNKLTSVTIPERVTSIGLSAFSDNDELTEVTIPASVMNIDSWAFDHMPIGGTVRLEGATPPSIEGTTFNRSRIDVDVPRNRRQAYLAHGWTGFRSMGIFTDKEIKYGITDVNPNEVMVLDFDSQGVEVDIPGTVDNNNENYTVTSIGQQAFRDKQLTEVTIPNTVTHIGGFAFANNQLNSVTIPDRVARIDSIAFMDNPDLAIVIMEATTPPRLHAHAFQNPGRNQIEVIVPRGTTAGNTQAAYETAWGPGFKYITEGIRVSIDAPALVDNLSPFDITFQFALDVTGFTVDGISVDDATLSEFTGGGSSYTVKVTPTTTCNGIIKITIPGNIATYAPGFSNVEASATVTVNVPPPSAPSVNSSLVQYCLGQPADALTATGDNLLWYTSETGGSGSATAPIPSTATAGTTSYYVSQTTNGCESERAVIVVTVMDACPIAIGDVFTVSGIDYEITSIDPGPNQVKVVDYTGSATAVEIPRTVDDKGETYTITAIGANAFSDNPDLTTVKIEATPPPSIHDDAFADRSQVDLVVPKGMIQAYLDEGWTGFASITEEQVVTAIRNYEFKDFTLYPNPARDKVYIDPRSGQELKQVNIYTMIGGYLYSENGPVINTARLPTGTYLFEIVTQTGDRSMRRVIIQ